MAQAVIKINGVAGSNDNLPIDTLVSLDNQNGGGEISYAWLILDQPQGTADVLSATNIQNPTFTPKKEGTYLIQLTVNGIFVNQVVVGIRYLKSLQRAPAAGETTQDSTPEGWSLAQNSLNSTVNDLVGTAGSIVAVAGENSMQGKCASIGKTPSSSGEAVIKAGLPGQETLPQVWIANSTMFVPQDVGGRPAGAVLQPLYYCVSKVGGGSPSSGDLVSCVHKGLVTGIAYGLTPIVGQPVFMSATGTPTLVPLTGGVQQLQGVFVRCVGHVVAFGGGTFDFWFDGGLLPKPSLLVFGASTTTADTTARYLNVGGPFGAASTDIFGLSQNVYCGTLTQLTLNSLTTADADLTVDTRIFSTFGGLLAVIDAGNNAGEDTTHFVSFATGLGVDVRARYTAGISSALGTLMATMTLYLPF